MMLVREDAASYGPKSAMVLFEPVDKHGSEVADKSVMTPTYSGSDLDQETARFRASGRVLRRGENDGKKTRVLGRCAGARCCRDRRRSGRNLRGCSAGPRRSYFGEFFRRMRSKLGTAQAITETAHEIARILYHVLRTKEPYSETVFHRCDEHARRRAEMRLRKQAALLGFQIIPNPAA